jgi:hypothetical protein
MPHFRDIRQKIRDNYRKIEGGAGANNRFRSWEHCYGFFRKCTPVGLATQRDNGALQLGFYLASWGMYRASGFLLGYDYTAHLAVIDCLGATQFLPLWETEFGAVGEDRDLVLEASEAVRKAYEPLGEATDTLVTKVILGTFGCLPACDRFFVKGFKRKGFKFSRLNAAFVDRVLEFCHDHLGELLEEQARIKVDSGKHYPLMKLIDMYFWQVGSKE